jgi:hypothetical protein
MVTITVDMETSAETRCAADMVTTGTEEITAVATVAGTMMHTVTKRAKANKLDPLQQGAIERLKVSLRFA